MNRKGQALVEFVLILPVLLIVIMSLIDIGNIFIKKYELNKSLDIIESYYENNQKQELLAYAANEDIEYQEKTENNLSTITLKKQITINAPILSNVIGRKYKIEVQTKIFGENNG